MSVFYQPGQELDSNDIRVYLKDNTGAPIDVLDIRYSIYFYDPLVKDWTSVPNQYHLIPQSGPDTGQYWAAWDISKSQKVGRYQVRWDLRNSLSDPYQQIKSEFAIVKFPHGTHRLAEVTDLPGTPIVIVL